MAKPIRLRNETIEPPAAKAQSGAPLAAAPSVTVTQSGLFLIQFTNAPTVAQRDQLAAEGIELLRYVPDDAFIARLRSANTQALTARRGANFLTPYLPKHKLDNQLAAEVKAKGNGVLSASMRVCIILAPGAPAAERLAVRRMLSRVRQENALRFTPVLRGDIDPSKVATLAESPAVLWIEPDRPMRMHDEVASKIVAGDGGSNQTLMQSLGFDGSGVIVAVADSGLNNGDAQSMHPDLYGRTPTFMFYGNLTDAADEHGHGTHVAGIVAGNAATREMDDNGALYGLGVAPGAQIIAQRIFDGEGNFEAPDSNETLTHDAIRAGAVIGSNSWGDDTQGRYDTSAAEFDELVRDADASKAGDQPYILEFSAGNAGPGAQTMNSPAVAKNVIATGACQSDRRDLYIYDTGPDTMADFSSRGPAEDGRIKPDIVAPGTWISSLQSASATSDNSWSPIDQFYQYEGGTSQAGPHASGAAAVFVQYYRSTHTNATPSPALVKAALINSATQMDPTVEVDPAPNFDEGWGRIDLTQLVASERRFDFTDQTVTMTNGQVWEHRVVVASSTQPFKVTLAYTDVPGLPAAIPALVNDLDLEVVSPAGDLFLGNQFIEGESVPNTGAADSINNVEGVFISEPVPGEYVVRVRAKNVVEDARRDTPVIDQDFALVASGDIPFPHQGLLVMDRSAYTAPGRINFRLFDSDLAGQPTLNIHVTSSTEPQGETITLKPLTTTGSYTGAVLTVTGTAVVDGKLQIANGDEIRAAYYDASSATNRVALAVADFVPPVLTDVTSGSDYGDMTVRWTSDEPSTSRVYYGTNGAFQSMASDSTLTTDHSLTLTGLVGGLTYQFYVVSIDEAGNGTTNNNAGSFFTFVAVIRPPVLVLDAGVDNSFFGMAPLSGYTDPLDQLGIPYDTWAADQQGVPVLSTLLNYRAVICRLPEIGSALSSAELVGVCNNLTSYVSKGGSLFIATMDGLSRLEESGATSFITNVLHVADHQVDTGVAQIIGSGDPVGQSMDTPLDYSPYESAWGDWIDWGLLDTADISDTITPTPDASPVLTDEYGDTVGLRWPKTGGTSSGRVVFCSFPFDAIPGNTDSVNNRATFLRNVLAFLIPGFNGISTIALDQQSYTVPSRVFVEVDDGDLAATNAATVVAYSPHAPNGIILPLVSLSKGGVFGASFTLVAPTNHLAPGQLPAIDRERIRIDYFDRSSRSTIVATAFVDTESPVVTDVVATPDYQNVTISWTTSEAADSSVQVGTTPLFDRSAADTAFSTYHELSVFGLAPDTDYLFEVVSRDSAGNAVIDDNHGQFYRFHTLQPLRSPWADNMDAGATNWTTFDSDTTQVRWTLGTPNNGLVSSAHSSTNAWCSNIDGVGVDEADTFLISPAIFLTGGNTATLHFWHVYDFTEKSSEDIIEQGQIVILTNNIGNSTPIAVYSGDALYDWEEEQIDLTPFIGQVIYVVWEYQCLSLTAEPRPGWVIDDVSISVSNIIQPGKITITNNLWQAKWTLSGAVSTNGLGQITTLSNVSPGDYVVRWSDVPDYSTPPPQTNTLTSGGKLNIAGIYTMTDMNSNGIPDSWEKRYFGTVTTNHPANYDSDGDGVSDYAEFIAGTSPTNAASVFAVGAVTAGTSGVQLQWTFATNRGYRILGSADAVNWAPVTDWLYNTDHFVIPPPTKGAPYLFRVEVKP